MGLYLKTNLMSGTNNGGRPIYENSNRQFLFFWAPSGQWLMGEDFNRNSSSVASIEQEHTQCPTNASGWKVLYDRQWQSLPRITLTAIRTTTSANGQPILLGSQLASSRSFVPYTSTTAWTPFRASGVEDPQLHSERSDLEQAMIGFGGAVACIVACALSVGMCLSVQKCCARRSARRGARVDNLAIRDFDNIGVDTEGG
jgi:hypothetical protein